MSALGHGRPFTRSVYPTATPTEAWRANALMVYAGNALSPTVTGILLTLPQHYRAGFNRLHGGFQA